MIYLVIHFKCHALQSKKWQILTLGLLLRGTLDKTPNAQSKLKEESFINLEGFTFWNQSFWSFLHSPLLNILHCRFTNLVGLISFFMSWRIMTVMELHNFLSFATPSKAIKPQQGVYWMWENEKKKKLYYKRTIKKNKQELRW